MTSANAIIAMARRGPDAVSMSTVADRLAGWARAMRRDVLAVWLAAGDPRVPWYAKVLAALVAAYALSPIDLIPDFIPVLGYLDDLLLVPLGVALVVLLIPGPLMAEFRAEAARRLQQPRSILGAVIVGLLWLVLAVWLIWLALVPGGLAS